MSLIVFTSFKGSPGTTLTALAAAAAWPTVDERRKLFLEADPDGGSIAINYQLGTKPGLISLAAAARKGLARDDLWDHAQELPGGLPVVLAPDGPEQATGVLRTSARELGEWLQQLPDVDVIADIGRLSLGSPAVELAAGADAVLVVVRPVADQLRPAAQRMNSLAQICPRLGWVLIGNEPYSETEVASAYNFPVVAVIDDDKRAAKALEDGVSPNKVRRSNMVRSVSTMTSMLHTWLHPPTETPAPVPEPDSPPTSKRGRKSKRRSRRRKGDNPSSEAEPTTQSPPVASPAPPGPAAGEYTSRWHVAKEAL